MIKGQITSTAKEHKLGILLLGLGIAGWAGSQYVGEWFTKFDFLSAVSTLAGAWDILQKRRDKKTADTVKEALPSVVESSVSKATADDMLAVVGAIVRTGTALEALKEDINKKHAENASLFAHLATAEEKNQAMHAEHVAVTDSHGVAIDALGKAVTDLNPDFALPPLHSRRAE